LRLLSGIQSKTWRVPTLLALFMALGIFRYHDRPGDDLGSSFLGCRVVAAHHAEDLYSYDPDDFASVAEDDKAWDAAANDGEFDGFIHPYVQTPLWAYALQPLCTRTTFPAFNNIFVVLTMFSFAGSIWLVARYWTPNFYIISAIGVTLCCLAFSEAFRYAMALMQTHVLFFLLTLAALIFARRRPIVAGLLLACAAAIKLTPAVLLVYWLITRRWKAAASLVLWSAALWIITIAVVPPAVVASYLGTIHRIAGILLIGQNNQSFAAWYMGRFYPSEDMTLLHVFPLPAAVRLTSTALMLAVTAAGGCIDRYRERFRSSAAPIGAMMALIAATIFSPIAWTHYSIILVAPLMVILHENRTIRSWQVAAIALFAILLNYKPLATDVPHSIIGPYSILRSQFYAAVLCLVALAVVAWKSRQREASNKTAAQLNPAQTVAT
jgi:uncharacterized membrane protein